jgi:hypothetical protein
MGQMNLAQIEKRLVALTTRYRGMGGEHLYLTLNPTWPALSRWVISPGGGKPYIRAGGETVEECFAVAETVITNMERQRSMQKAG